MTLDESVTDPGRNDRELPAVASSFRRGDRDREGPFAEWCEALGDTVISPSGKITSGCFPSASRLTAALNADRSAPSRSTENTPTRGSTHRPSR